MIYRLMRRPWTRTLVAAVVARRNEVGALWREGVLFAVLSLVSVFSLHVVAFRLLRADPSDPLIVGRYLLPLIAPVAVALAFTVTTLPQRSAQYMASGVIMGIVLLQLGALGMTFARFYG